MPKRGTITKVSGTRQKQVINEVYQPYKNSAYATPLFLLTVKGVCTAYSAFYIINRVADRGDFWSWLEDPLHKWSVISQYLGGDYRLLPPNDAILRCQDLIKSRLQQLGSPYTVDGANFNASRVFYHLCPTDQPFGATLCVMTKGEGEGHAVAAITGTSPPYASYLDPNHGELHFSKRKGFEHWWRGIFAQEYGSHFTRANFVYYGPR